MEVKTEPGLCAVCGEPPEEHSEEEKQKCLDKASAGRQNDDLEEDKIFLLFELQVQEIQETSADEDNLPGRKAGGNCSNRL